MAKKATQAKKPAKVKVTIPRIPGVKEQPPYVLGLNGRNYQFQRGVEVEVPRGVAENIAEQAEMRGIADDYMFANEND